MDDMTIILFICVCLFLCHGLGIVDKRARLGLTPFSKAHMMYIVLSVDEMIFSFFFFPRFDILVDGYNSLDRNISSLFLLFRAHDIAEICT